MVDGFNDKEKKWKYTVKKNSFIYLGIQSALPKRYVIRISKITANAEITMRKKCKI
jgi:hypothetical protein